MNEILERALLYDFYGELLTKRQKEIYGQFIFEDLSLAEIAKEEGVSRQGVHDLIRRCERALRGYEGKLGLVGKFLAVREKAARIERLLEESGGEPKGEIRKLAKEIVEEL